MKHYIILTFLIFISTINRNGFLIADDIYPGDYHNMNDIIKYSPDINATNISLSIIDKKVKFNISGVDGEFFDLNIRRFKLKLFSEKHELFKTLMKVAEIGENEKIASSNDYQALSKLIEQYDFITTDVEYISDMADLYQQSIETNSDIILKKQIAKLIKIKSSHLFNRLVTFKTIMKSKVDFKKLSSELILPIYIKTTERYSSLMNESKSLYDSIPVTNWNKWNKA